MSTSLLDELHWLTEALRAHAEWSRSTGSMGLPACDAIVLDERRDHYRRTALRDTYDESPSIPSRAMPATNVATSPAATTTLGQSVDRPPISEGLAAVSLRPAITQTNKPVEPVLATSAGKSIPQDVAPAHASALSRAPQHKPVVQPSSADVPALGAEQKQARLVTLQQEVLACTSCGLCNERKRPAFARGSGASKIAFVGEGPGAEEDAQGIPFVGAAGQLLDRMIGAMGIARDDVYVCNVIKCRPPNNRKPTDEEVATCRHFVVEQLRLIEPQVIVALGATAVEGLLGLKLGITRLRGTWRLYDGRIPVMPTFHPAYLLRKPEAKREVWDDLQAVLARVNRTLPPRA